jgi:hypothetical protein
VVPDVLVNRFVNFLHESGSGDRIGMTSLSAEPRKLDLHPCTVTVRSIRLSTAINASE